MFLTNFITKSVEKKWRLFSPVFRGKIAVNWHVSKNFGDVLSIYIANKLGGMETLNVPDNSKELHYQITGSILSHASKTSLVWGTGFANKTDSFYRMPRKIFMVRGEYSLEKCRQLGLKNDVVVGDPGYIISRLYNPLCNPKNIQKKYTLGIIPHWVDYEFSKKLFESRPDCFVINLLNLNIEEVINQILQCKQCISSSLHGLVVAHSYDIPTLHVTFSDHILNTGLKKFNIPGDGLKFFDYFSSVGIKEYLPTEITHPDMIEDVLVSIPSNCGNKKQIEKILSVCPFLKTDVDFR